MAEPTIPPVTNPSPEEVLASFDTLGMLPIPPDMIDRTILRVLVSRGLYLAAHSASAAEHDESQLIHQELANRMMGREPAFK